MYPHIKPVKAKGQTYYYFRTGVKKPNGSEVLRKLPDLRHPDFGSVYGTLMGHRERRDKVPEVLTLATLCDQWEASRKFREYAEGTKKLYRISMAHVRKELPTAPAGELAREDIATLIEGMEDRPGAANSVLRTVRSLYKWARSAGKVKNDPARDIAEFDLGEHDPWDLAVLTAALKANNDRVRLGTHLLYYTAQRIEDVVRIRKEDVRDGIIYLTQMKTGMDMEIPVHRDLAAELAKHEHDGEYLFRGQWKNRPLHQQTLRTDIQDWVKEKTGAVVVPHGLRKNGVIALLESGCNVAQVSSISGQTLKMVEHYSKKRNRSKLAISAMKLWEGDEA